jgi:D-cysteine desulfhydrase
VFGAGYGGNKVRKLEWLLADARARQRRTILTAGGLGTNFGLATALYARELGIATEIALVDQPRDEHVGEQLERLRALAALHFTHTRARTVVTLAALAVRVALRDRRAPLVLRPGGSSPLGALGYVEAALELAEQVQANEVPEPARIVVATGSGGTAAGLALGLALAGLRTRVTGVIVAHQLRLDAPAIARLAGRSARLLARRGAQLPPEATVGAADLDMTREFLGPGYGHPTAAGEQAQRLAGERAGLVLDPVYTAKGLAGALAIAARGGGPVLFLNTYDALSRRRRAGSA